MNKLVTVLLVFVFTLIGSFSYAHSPSEIKLNFDYEAKILKAIILHSVADSDKHYIKEIKIKKNNKEILVHKLSRQDNNTEQEVSYLIPDINDSDTLTIIAYCSKIGQIKKDIKITFNKESK
ncbi:MAG: hypothetical protein A2474_05690 [Elusimicrobia bacterium RIFOXYC2_FULL_34_12]|nr:MAG: hypothetical protein A2474_05690 [Elusimicrobia bacterium RIFOXYC2_FULL_34_12]OGS38752.1 MAG: hypothetical protein A2551_00950 [Elusimicrobia bacterium RIFOXYD2_FULL_34_30]HAM38965.1 hypothetical protein [Elusimicrobiota bacterium]